MSQEELQTETQENNAPESLRFEVSDLSEVDESFQGFYQEYEGKYRLKVEGVDDAKELKNALQKEREERKAAKQRLKEIEDKQKEQEKASLLEKEEFKTLWEQEKERTQQLQEEYLGFKQQVDQHRIENEALAISSLEGAGDHQTELLTEQVKKHIKVTDGRVNYEVGGVAVDKTDLINHLRSRYPILFKPTGSSGGGTAGSISGGVTGNGSSPQGDFGGTIEQRRAAIASKFKLKN